MRLLSDWDPRAVELAFFNAVAELTIKSMSTRPELIQLMEVRAKELDDGQLDPEQQIWVDCYNFAINRLKGLA